MYNESLRIQLSLYKAKAEIDSHPKTNKQLPLPSQLPDQPLQSGSRQVTFASLTVCHLLEVIGITNQSCAALDLIKNIHPKRTKRNRLLYLTFKILRNIFLTPHRQEKSSPPAVRNKSPRNNFCVKARRIGNRKAPSIKPILGALRLSILRSFHARNYLNDFCYGPLALRSKRERSFKLQMNHAKTQPTDEQSTSKDSTPNATSEKCLLPPLTLSPEPLDLRMNDVVTEVAQNRPSTPVNEQNSTHSLDADQDLEGITKAPHSRPFDLGRSISLAMVKSNPHMIQFFTRNLDPTTPLYVNFILEAIKLNPAVIRFIDRKGPLYSEIISTATQQTPRAAQYLPKIRRSNKILKIVYPIIASLSLISRALYFSL
jgi:hypothetical protein